MVKRVCEDCGTTFEIVDCDACRHYPGDCTGVHDPEINMCQVCCEDDFSRSINPFGVG